jgi:plasmid maintenance system killer protein
MRSLLYFCLVFAITLASCRNEQPEADANLEIAAVEKNPAAPGFRADASDEKAIAIADSVMEAMGGRRTWDQSRYFHWNFFNRRTLLWDKKTGNVRITMLPDSSTVMALNLNTGEGQVRVDGALVTEPDSLANLLKQGKSIWINDAYWVFMPFKLKDSGVALKYQGVDTTQAGEVADVLQLTFEEVGDTPQNKYLVWVDQDEHLVRQWAYFRDAADEAPGFVVPWQNYQEYNGLKLSGDRGERQITGIEVLGTLPDEAFRLE